MNEIWPFHVGLSEAALVGFLSLRLMALTVRHGTVKVDIKLTGPTSIEPMVRTRVFAYVTAEALESIIIRRGELEF